MIGCFWKLYWIFIPIYHIEFFVYSFYCVLIETKNEGVLIHKNENWEFFQLDNTTHKIERFLEHSSKYGKISVNVWSHICRMSVTV